MCSCITFHLHVGEEKREKRKKKLLPIEYAQQEHKDVSFRKGRPIDIEVKRKRKNDDTHT